ncbi:AraC family transcriptional regulator [Amycolatopsis suaedae]|uniref:AraC family transcriptional regulator n=1 Tax=Amycolatopsis suaedae TaxID=2510978 RepID=A0A4Q7JEQ8_9PSEU|nr:AraC family transcriptional regulator [Amycolatopsis suaedae]RZQ66009.1 AraC family transcriptional regulator [Amycolatopsis suaedae]
MDVLAGLLEGPRARGAFLLRSILDPPWSLRIRDEAPLTVVVPVRGEAWIVPGDEAPQRLDPGDVAVVRGPRPYTVADDPATEPQAVILPGGKCHDTRGEPLRTLSDLGVRTWGSGPHGRTVLLTGTYPNDGEVPRRLLSALPTVVVQRAAAWDNPLAGLLTEEIVKDEPGQQAVLDRLLDLLVIAVLRNWMARPDAEVPAWYRAQGDPVVGPALKRLHHHPARPWTVADLAAEVGVSRAALARRFTELVGESPMRFLTGWRLALAADLLRQPDVTLGAVARQVGYGSAFALSTAFKREHGVSPQQYRARVPV